MRAVAVRGFASKLDLLDRHCRDRFVLHLGAVGETCQDTERRVAAAAGSVHAHLTRVARTCVGVDNDAPSVTSLTDRGIFDNLVLADVTRLRREQVDLPAIEVIVVGDTIEHLAEPGRLLDALDPLAEPGTRLVVTTPNALGLAIFLRHLAGRPVDGPDHVCSFNAYTLVNLLTRYRWRVQELWTCHQPAAARLNPGTFRLGRLVLDRLPRLGGTLFLVASRDSARDRAGDHGRDRGRAG